MLISATRALPADAPDYGAWVKLRKAGKLTPEYLERWTYSWVKSVSREKKSWRPSQADPPPTPASLRLLVFLLASLADGYGYVSCTGEEFSVLMGCDLATVNKRRRVLRDTGWVQWVARDTAEFKAHGGKFPEGYYGQGDPPRLSTTALCRLAIPTPDLFEPLYPLHPPHQTDEEYQSARWAEEERIMGAGRKALAGEAQAVRDKTKEKVLRDKHTTPEDEE